MSSFFFISVLSLRSLEVKPFFSRPTNHSAASARCNHLVNSHHPAVCLLVVGRRNGQDPSTLTTDNRRVCVHFVWMGVWTGRFSLLFFFLWAASYWWADSGTAATGRRVLPSVDKKLSRKVLAKTTHFLGSLGRKSSQPSSVPQYLMVAVFRCWVRSGGSRVRLDRWRSFVG